MEKSTPSQQLKVSEDYTADAEGAISVPKGALVEIVEQTNDQWWTVQYKGEIGYVPASLLGGESNKTPPPLPSFKGSEEKTEKKATVLFDSEPQDPSDDRVLPLKTGTEITVLEENYENSEWSLVQYQGNVGLIPNNYYQIRGEKSSGSNAAPSSPPPNLARRTDRA